MKRLPVWFERTENLAIAAAVVVAFVHLHFSWWWLPVFFLTFDASMAGYLVNERAGAVCYNLAHSYIAPAVLLLSYVLSGTRWCAFAGLLWAFHIAGDRVLGYGLKFASSFQDTHLGRIGKQRLPGWRAKRPSRRRTTTSITNPRAASAQRYRCSNRGHAEYSLRRGEIAAEKISRADHIGGDARSSLLSNDHAA